MKIEKKLTGKTIKEAKIIGLGKDYDDKPILRLTMRDNSVFDIIADYLSYTGKSEDEYPRVIKVKQIKQSI